MAGFEVNISIDPDRFLAAIYDWSAQVKIQNRAGAVEAGEFLKELVQENLMRYPHPPDEPTESPPFVGPVGYVYGRLHDSVTLEIMPISGFAKVYAQLHGPGGAIYARIQELGGWTGNHHTTFLPPRPYFRPAVEEIDTTGPGGMEHIFYGRWKQAQEDALHGVAMPGSGSGGFSAFLASSGGSYGG